MPDSDKLLRLKLEVFALNSTLNEGDLLLEAEQMVKDQAYYALRRVSVKLDLFSPSKPTNNGAQMASHLNVLRNTDYKVVIRQKEDIHKDGNTQPLMTFYLRYDAHNDHFLSCSHNKSPKPKPKILTPEAV